MFRFLLFLLLLMPASLFSQAVEHYVYAVKLNLNQPFFKNHNLKEVRFYEEDAPVANGGSFLSKVQYFNEEGQLTREITIDHTGNDTTVTTISYEGGRVMEMSITHPFYGTESTTFTYGEDRLISHERSGMEPAQFFYTYNADGQITKIVEKAEEQDGRWYEAGRTMLEYDPQGRLIKASEYEMGYLKGHTVYRYDGSGHLARLSRYEEGEMVLEVHYSYENGLLATTRTQIPALDIVAKQRAEYVMGE